MFYTILGGCQIDNEIGLKASIRSTCECFTGLRGTAKEISVRDSKENPIQLPQT